MTSRQRVWLLRFAGLGLGLVLVVVAELLLHLVPALAPEPFLVTLAERDERRLRSINPLYAKRFFLQRYQGKLIGSGRMGTQPFFEPTPSKRFRVVFAGASTVQGYPYVQSLAAPSFLAAMLQDIWPAKEVQVLNLGITSIASFAVARVVEDALQLEPDLVVVYTGHNEFNGIYGVDEHHSPWRNRLHYFLMQRRLTALVRTGLDYFRGSEVSSTALARIMAERGQVALDSPRRRVAPEHLRANLLSVAAACSKAEVPLILCTLAANESGFAPGAGAAPPLEEHLARQWQQQVAKAAEVLVLETPPLEAVHGALENLTAAAQLWEKHAYLWYLRGRALVHLQHPAEARQAFAKARQLDTMPWRAPRSFNAVIDSVARQSGTGLADVQAAFDLAAPPEGVGWELMADHLHPSVAGQALLARTVVEAVPQVVDEPVELERLRSDVQYRDLLGDLPVGRLRVYQAMAELFSRPPMDRYNAHNATRYQRLAKQLWEGLSAAEQRGAEQWMRHREQGLLALQVAEQLFAVRDFPTARSYYRAARWEAPFTLRGDLWAAVQWGRTFALSGEAISGDRAAVLQRALQRLPFIVGSAPADPGFAALIKGQLHFLLGQYQQALTPLLQALEAPQIQREYIFVLFPALAETLIYNDRLEDARRLARQFAAEGSHTQYFIPLVETLAGDSAKRGAL